MSETKSQESNNTIKNFFYLVAFIEGGAVMACELLGAKMIAPYYGASLYVWTAVIGVTLGGLTTGYYIGGYLSAKHPNTKLLFLILLISALFMGIMPMTSSGIMEATLSMEIRTGSTISCLVFLFPPLVCFGMVSPMIIRLITTNVKKVGRFAGNVYAISTVGGILATFLFGFYVIPYLGLRFGAYSTATTLGLMSLVFYFVTQKSSLVPADN
ncbi:MAG: hypothetical protein COC01_04575 [Bacteroidetes bacterium]|nr:fused MFS/spermidine synthase [Bacteroidia bacterium]PCH68029.1 MAG: hypothetical protein COC01_04575 [Bacteroidota bacterium]